jgi:poly(A) polymerase
MLRGGQIAVEDYPSHPIDPTIVDSSLAQIIYRDALYTVRIHDVVALLQDAGFRVYVVGGACRDWLAGARAKDIDLSLDRPGELAHEVLRRSFPQIDPVLRRFERFGMVRWGDAASGGVDLNILRSYQDIQNDDMWTTSFVARQDLHEDALTRDFSINAFYYPCHGHGRLLDPLDLGLADLRQRILRLVAHRRILDTSYSTTCRIIQFLCRGYTPAPNVMEYLERHVDRDIQGMKRGLLYWILGHFTDVPHEQIEQFKQRLRGCASQDESRTLLDSVFAELEARPITQQKTIQGAAD